MQSLKTIKRQITIGKLLAHTQFCGAPSICSAPVKTQNALAIPMNKEFSKFYKGKKKGKGNSDASNSFKTYTLEQMEELGLTLEGGIDALPPAMKKNLERAGVNSLFPVQSSTFSLFAQEESELIVKSRTGTGKTLAFLLPLEYLLKHKEGVDSGSRGKVKAIILEPTRELATQVQT